ncbi:MAG: 3-hydroxyacyl-CoA dehydrogenase/enoyl-CoA hydratase family protein [Sulfolobales archaeon]
MSSSKRIKRVSVIGAGTMGHGIAEISAIAGYEVVIVDVSEDILRRALSSIRWSLGKLKERGTLREDVDTVMSRIRSSLSIAEAVREADIVIEAVPENLDLKKKVFKEMDLNAPSHTILATNTSSLPISEIAEATNRPDKVIGIHFFNPPVLMPLVEIVMGEKTSKETLDIAVEFTKSLGKEIVVVKKDIPGFIVNRILGRVVAQACYMVDAGEADPISIDSAVRYKLGLPMGVFELLDYSGIDVFVFILNEMSKRGYRFKPCKTIEEKFRAGEYGMKTGRGFYTYPEPGKYSRPSIPREPGEKIDVVRIFAPAINEAANLIHSNIVESAEIIDKAVRLGLGYPRGLLEMADEWGIDTIVNVLRELKTRYEIEDYEPSPLLLKMVSENKLGRKTGSGFYVYGVVEEKKLTTIVIRKEGKVGWIILNRPERLNAINPDMIRELSSALDELEADDSIRVIVITGSGRAFSAGADVTGFVGINPVKAYIFSRRFQELLDKIERLAKPVIAAINGYALGGGLEIALACDMRIASEAAMLGQPEINLGIIPGAGGTQRLSRLVGSGRALELIFTGDMIPAKEAERIGLVNRVVASEHFEREVRSIATKISEKAPIALMAAKHAVRYGYEAPLASGLALEAAEFGLLFSTEDVIEGVSAFLQKRKPEFKGR